MLISDLYILKKKVVKTTKKISNLSNLFIILSI